MYNIMLVSTIQQRESVLSIYICPSNLNPPPTPHPSRLSQSGLSSLATYSAYGNVYDSILLSSHPTLSFPNCAHKSVLCVCIFIPTLQGRNRIVSSVPFSRFHISVLIYNTFLSLTYFTLFNRLQVHPPH